MAASKAFMVIYGSITLALSSVDMIPLCASPVKLLYSWSFAPVDHFQCIGGRSAAV